MTIALLKNIGLHEKYARLYLAALALGTASVQALAEKAGVKRPTAYLHIHEMLHEGLFEKVPLGKKEYYKPAHPSLLEKRAQKNLQATHHLVAELETLQTAVTGRPGVTVLEGEKALQQVYDEICLANSIRFWSNLSAFETLFSEHFIKISTAIRENQITTREIIANNPAVIHSAKRYAASAGPSYSARCAEKGTIENDSAIYGDTLALFRIYECNLYVILIKDPTITATMKTLFDMAWKQAKPL